MKWYQKTWLLWIVILSYQFVAGSDPAAQLLRFAKETRGSTLHLDTISLGRGQGPKAEQLIAKAQILKGRWIFLQNCHLAASWMPKFKAVVEKYVFLFELFCSLFVGLCGRIQNELYSSLVLLEKFGERPWKPRQRIETICRNVSAVLEGLWRIFTVRAFHKSAMEFDTLFVRWIYAAFLWLVAVAAPFLWRS